MKENQLETKYASAKRSPFKTILKQNTSIKQADFLEEVFSKIPLMFLILNRNRQIIYMNSLLEKDLAEKNLDVTLGIRPGELMQCQNAFTEAGGCGTSHHCRYCGIVNSVLESEANDTLVTKETRFVSNQNSESSYVDYNVSSKPFLWDNEKYTIVSLSNISDSKRKEQLERTFFHDLLNKATSVNGLSEIINNDVSPENLQLLGLLRRGIIDLTNEILFQRNLTEAENGNFTPNLQSMNSIELLKSIKDDFLSYELIAKKYVIISERSDNVRFDSDKVVINRIFTNLIKNALEAIKQEESVTIGVMKKEDTIVLWVQNNTVIPQEIKDQLFKRSFSTKGVGRGLGTYSVKLFTEQYLKGKVYFDSDVLKGTVFYVELPLIQEPNKMKN